MKEQVMNAIIDHLKKSPVLQTAAASADSLMDQINQRFRHEPISLDALAKGLSPATDEIIVRAEKSESLTFLGGELVFSTIGGKPNRFSAALKLYFNDAQGKVLLKENLKELDFVILTPPSASELASLGSATFVVDPPAGRS